LTFQKKRSGDFAAFSGPYTVQSTGQEYPLRQQGNSRMGLSHTWSLLLTLSISWMHPKGRCLRSNSRQQRQRAVVEEMQG